MPKKSPKKEAEEARLIAWYKWEFLRRNAKYRRDYDGFIREFGDWFHKHGYWYDHDVEPWGRKNLLFFAEVIAPRAKLICERWQIGDPLPPTMTFKKPGSKDYKHYEEFLPPTDCSKEKAGQAWDLSKLVADSRLSDEEFLNTLPESTAKAFGPEPDYHLDLAFDLRLPVEFLLRQAKDRITSRKHVYDRRHPNPHQMRLNVRRRLDVYDQYLLVWDLRSQGEKFETIGAMVFRDEQGRGPHAMDCFSRAQQLIDGGYKELR